MTEGTAKPKAHGHEATSTPIPLSTIQQIEHISSFKITILNLINSVQTNIVNRLKHTTAFTKIFEIDLHTACMP